MREALAAAVLFVSSFIAFHIDFEFPFEPVRYRKNFKKNHA